MMKRIAILQSNYIPWKGYFDLINSVDEFVLYDDMQFTKRDWRNRNKIKANDTVKWLTIPVEVKGKYYQKINETKVSDQDWARKHWQTIKAFYSKAPFFKVYSAGFESLYSNFQDTLLTDINEKLIRHINSILGIKTIISRSSNYELVDGQTERLLSICEQAGASIYLSGPAAKSYFDMSLAEKFGIEIHWMDYENYPEYPQLGGQFEHFVTILDLIFNVGPDAPKYMKSFTL